MLVPVFELGDGPSARERLLQNLGSEDMTRETELGTRRLTVTC